MLRIIYLGLISCLISCSAVPDQSIVNQVKSLKTVAQQKSFLEQVLAEDQGVRKNVNRIRNTYGDQSDSLNLAYEQMSKIDEINIQKIESYIQIHGYPEKEKHGSDACFAPVIVLHHSPEGFNFRKSHFKTLYKAYIDGHHESMDMYLTRMYYIKHNEHLNIEGPYTEAFEIDTLIKSLGLEELREEAMMME